MQSVWRLKSKFHRKILTLKTVIHRALKHRAAITRRVKKVMAPVATTVQRAKRKVNLAQVIRIVIALISNCKNQCLMERQK